MSLLLDFLPILFFFATFKYAEAHRAWSSGFATEHLGQFIIGGFVNEQDAPVLLATAVVMVGTLLQVLFMLVRGRKVNSMLLISLGLVTVLGSATIWFHDKRLIMWKPTVLYWATSLVFWFKGVFSDTTMMEIMVGGKLKLPAHVWKRLNASWVWFFVAMGLLNLFVAYSFSTDAWVTFKMFGGLGLIVAFVLLQGLYMDRHVIEDEPEKRPAETAKQLR